MAFIVNQGSCEAGGCGPCGGCCCLYPIDDPMDESPDATHYPPEDLPASIKIDGVEITYNGDYTYGPNPYLGVGHAARGGAPEWLVSVGATDYISGSGCGDCLIGLFTPGGGVGGSIEVTDLFHDTYDLAYSGIHRTLHRQTDNKCMWMTAPDSEGLVGVEKYRLVYSPPGFYSGGIDSITLTKPKWLLFNEVSFPVPMNINQKHDPQNTPAGVYDGDGNTYTIS